MHDSIGFVELNSIAKGIETADHMIKAAEVVLVAAKPTCPGKFIIMVTGDVAAISASVDTGVCTGKESVVDYLVIPRVHNQVIEALNGAISIQNKNALGVIEYFSISAAIMGADAAVKSADVELMDIRPGIGIGGKAFITLTGDVSAVNAAVDAASKTAIENGLLINAAIIPNPKDELFNHLI